MSCVRASTLTFVWRALLVKKVFKDTRSFTLKFLNFLYALSAFTILVSTLLLSSLSLLVISTVSIGNKKILGLHVQKTSQFLLYLLRIKVHVLGKPNTQPSIYVANHRSYIDVPIILSQIHGCLLAKEEIAVWPIVSFVAKLMGTVFVRRDNKRSCTQALFCLGKKIRTNSNVILFPEGTTCRGPHLKPYKKGIFALSVRHQFPVIPISIEYSNIEDAWIDEDTFMAHFFNQFTGRTKHVFVEFGSQIITSSTDESTILAFNWTKKSLNKINQKINLEVNHETKI